MLKGYLIWLASRTERDLSTTSSIEKNNKSRKLFLSTDFGKTFFKQMVPIYTGKQMSYFGKTFFKQMVPIYTGKQMTKGARLIGFHDSRFRKRIA